MGTEGISSYASSDVAFHHVVTEELNDKFYMHSHNVCEMTFLISGDVSWVIEGKTYKMRKNDLVILRPNVVHGVHVHSDEPYERYNISFNDKILADNALDDIDKKIEVVNLSSNTHITDLFEKLDFYSKAFQGERAKILISNIVEELVFNLTLQASGKSDENITLFNPMLSRALEYIDTNYTECIDLDDICRELYISKSYLHSLFSEHLRLSPKKYVNLKRLAYAQHLIRKGKKPYDMYQKCGFSDYSSFYRNYKNHFGNAPSYDLKNDTRIEILT